MGERARIKYAVDIVFCIDCTGSMRKIIDMVKQNALNFYPDIVKIMAKKDKNISQLRLRVVAFRDYKADGNEAMLVTDFFDMPTEEVDFRDCVNSLVAKGGGDVPEDGLEALAYAIKSNWNTEGDKKRQVIVVWTDAPTHELGFAADSPNYPRGMARNLEELSAWWGDAQNNGFVSNNAKRLVLFAPDQPAWNFIASNWDNVLFSPARPDGGLEEYDYNIILNSICNSI